MYLKYLPLLGSAQVERILAKILTTVGINFCNMKADFTAHYRVPFWGEDRLVSIKMLY